MNYTELIKDLIKYTGFYIDFILTFLIIIQEISVKICNLTCFRRHPFWVNMHNLWHSVILSFLLKRSDLRFILNIT